MAIGTTMQDRPWAIGAAIAGFAMLAGYLTLISAEGGHHFWDIAPWALLMATPASLALVSSQIDDVRSARKLLAVSAFLFLGIGAVSIFSIGMGFIAVAGIAAIGTTKLTAS